jgi:DNA-binding beta-propeller fold protein YncE
VDADGGSAPEDRVRAGGAAGALLAAALLAAGCGSSEGNPPPAEPAISPPLTERPAGQVRRVGSEAEGVVADPLTGLAAISFRDPNRIDLIDVATGRTVERVPTGDPARHLSLAGPGGPVLAPIEYRDELLRIELPSGRASSVDVGDFPHDAAEAADGRVFVSDEGGDTVSVVDGDRVEATLPSPEQPGGIATAGDTVAVVAVAAREIAFIDATTLERVSTVEGGAGPSHIVAGPDDGTDRFYVADTGGDAVLVYEGGPEPRLLDRTNVADSPYGIAVDGRRGHLWVTQTARNRVVEMEVTDIAPKIIASYPTVRQPNSVAVDERSGRVIVVGRDSGDVQIFDPERAGAKP